MVQALQDPDPRVQSAGAYWLGNPRFAKEPLAKTAVPLLLKALQSTDPNLKRNAATTLKTIEPQAIPER
jgi:HEAT repeat protein